MSELCVLVEFAAFSGRLTQPPIDTFSALDHVFKPAVSRPTKNLHELLCVALIVSSSSTPKSFLDDYSCFYS